MACKPKAIEPGAKARCLMQIKAFSNILMGHSPHQASTLDLIAVYAPNDFSYEDKNKIIFLD